MVSAQLELVSGSPGAAKVAQVDLMVQPGFQLPEDDPQGAAEPAAADALLRAALPSVAQEVNDTAAAVVKEECVRESPAWKARAAREAAQVLPLPSALIKQCRYCTQSWDVSMVVSPA